MTLVAAISAFVAVLLLGLPRLALSCDRLVARRRLAPTPNEVDRVDRRADRHRVRVDSRPAHPSSGRRMLAWADACERTARAIRAGEAVDGALADVPSVGPDDPWQVIRVGLDSRRSLVAAVGDARARAVGDAERMLGLVTACVTGHTFDPDGLDTVAAVMRDRHTLHGELRVATAQARLTVRLLTALPLVGGCLALVASASVRRGVTSGALIPPILGGLALNAVGRWWAARAIHGATRRDDADPVLADVAAVALRAGRGVPEVIDHVRRSGRGPDANELENNLARALRDGLPVTHVAERLAAESRARRRRDADEAMRRLPALLAFPVVLCILPSFLLLGVLPLVVAATTHLAPTAG